MLVTQVGLAAKHQQVEVAQLGLMALVTLRLHKPEQQPGLEDQVMRDLVALLVREVLAETGQNLAPYMDRAVVEVDQIHPASLAVTMAAAEVLLLITLDQLPLALVPKA
jgi:hypothetical protein